MFYIVFYLKKKIAVFLLFIKENYILLKIRLYLFDNEIFNKNFCNISNEANKKNNNNKR